MNTIKAQKELSSSLPDLRDPDLISHLSQAKQRVWTVLKSHYKEIEHKEFRIDLTNLANQLGYSRTTIYHAVKTLISGNLLKKVREVRGRGNHGVFQLLWSFYPQNETPPEYTTCIRPTPRCIAKDTPSWRYYAAQFRRICEKSTKLKDHQRGVVGKLLQKLRGKEARLWEKAEIFFQRKANEGLNVTGFFVWLHKYLNPEIDRSEQTKKQTQLRDEREKEMTKLLEQNGEHPKIKDYSSFEAYDKAYESWQNSQ